ncbi:hypothetical protein LMI97_06940 [Legionella sp. 31fI33]|nr:hypothetical protein [Legionella sp. 31fI33]
MRAARGETARRTAVYTSVHEDSSTGSTKRCANAVEVRKKSLIPLLTTALNLVL